MRKVLVVLSWLLFSAIVGMQSYRMGIGKGADIIAEISGDVSASQAFRELYHAVALTGPDASPTAKLHGEALLREALIQLYWLRKSKSDRSCYGHQRRVLASAAQRYRSMPRNRQAGKDAQFREALNYCEGARDAG